MARPHASPKRKKTPAHRLPGRVARWLFLEQHVNEQIYNEAVFAPIRGSNNGVLSPYRPETSASWRQDVIFVNARSVRSYGPVSRVVDEALGLRIPSGKAPLLIHPQSRRLFAERIADAGLVETDTTVRPTSSCRSLVTSRAGREPWVLKVGIDTLIAGRWRGLEEHQIARAILLSGLLREMDPAMKASLCLDWFDEVCGVATDVTGAVPDNTGAVRDTSGWLLRRLPGCLRGGTSTLVPLFSLVSGVDARPSMLTAMIRHERADPSEFVIERLIRPLVRAYAHLAFGEGMFAEMHSQNVLYEVGADGRLTGQVVIRDVTDMTVNLALRIAQRRPLPAPRAELLPPGRRLELAWIASESFITEWTQRSHRAHVCVSRHGMQGSVWVIHRGLRAVFPDISFVRLKSAYLWMWRKAARDYLQRDPVIQPGLVGIPVDEAVASFLATVDWRGLGARPCQLPRGRLHWVGHGPPQPPGSRGLSLETAWGELFLVDGSPAYFRAAF